MKILHIAPNSPYNEGWGYQDNLLPKYHQKLGHEVTLIVTDLMHQDGTLVRTAPEDYRRPDGVRVIRLARRQYPIAYLTNLCAKMQLGSLLEELGPDFVFFHGLVSHTIFDVIQYKKTHPDCVIVRDNHLDYNIGRPFASLRDKAVRAFYRRAVARSMPYVDKVYGVTPWRKQFAEDYFKVPADKTGVLIMGADDDKIDFENAPAIRADIRRTYGIGDDEFLVVTGGKIDAKKNIHVLLEACRGLEGVRVLVFGDVEPGFEETFTKALRETPNAVHIGWIQADAVYDYFFAADLVVFPGQHSVMWEQACAAKAPCVFMKWEGMDHVNNGGNSDFVHPVTPQTLREKIGQLRFTPKYEAMVQAARSEKTDIYLYSAIAKKSLECVTDASASDLQR